MKTFGVAVAAGTSVLAFTLALSAQGQPTPAPAGTVAPQAPAVPSAESAPPAASASSALIKQYCVGCHNDRNKANVGGLALVGFDPAKAAEHTEIAEKMIRKLRAGMMPPPGARRPDAAALTALAAAMETRIDAAAAANPNPGWRPFQRLNRAEYKSAVEDLLALDVDVDAFLPPDTISGGFDNVSDAQMFSPTLMEGYLRAAAKISVLAAGDPNATPTSVTYKVARTAEQMRRVDGAPYGTRGGVSTIHVFPADGEYVFKIMLHSIPTGQLFGSTTPGEKIEVSINGERVALLDIQTRMSEQDPTGMWMSTPPVTVKAGPQRVTAAFLQRFVGPVDDLLAPIEHTLADTQIGSGFGVTALPHVREFAITGPHKVTGISDTPSRRRIFTCRPTVASEEAACAAEILKRLATQAYRGPVTATDLKGLMGFFETGRAGGDFESGIRLALQAMLASPRFVFRLEQAPAAVRAGQNYRISDLDLASRLSFFLWGTVPDAELVKAATAGTLRTPAGFERQVRRLLADERSAALSTRFASQWLRLQDVDKINPDALLYPQWDHTLAEALKRESELFFDSLIREDRSLLDLVTADYTFANERVAKHYGIPNVMGAQFRRVALPENRRGITGHASVLLLTSVADRTSPVQRGKWVMEVLLGSPPPAPPANVPLFEETKGIADGKFLSVRARMEHHRSNPACTSCHRVIDPLGLTLENYDVTGQWRIKDSEVPVDASGDLYDGLKMDGPAGLRAALLKHQDLLILSFTEKLMTYALGRRVEAYDMPAIRAIIREAAKQDYRMSAFISGVAKSAAFQMGRAEAPATTVVER